MKWERDVLGGKEFYSLPEDYVAMQVVSLVSPIRRVLVSESNETIEARPPATGVPQSYAMVASTYRLYPVPDGTADTVVGRLRLFGVRKLPPLVNSGDENGWTNEAFEMVREAASARVFYTVLHEEQYASLAAGEADRARDALLRRFRLRQPPARIVPCL